MNGIEGVSIPCPHCGESIEVFVDLSLSQQSYTEDCPVCCSPMVLQVSVDETGIPNAVAVRE